MVKPAQVSTHILSQKKVKLFVIIVQILMSVLGERTIVIQMLTAETHRAASSVSVEKVTREMEEYAQVLENSHL